MTGLDFVTDGYRAANPDFPHQSTIDQFFEPDRFEAYRDLGKKSASEAIKQLKQLKLADALQQPKVILANFKAIWDTHEQNLNSLKLKNTAGSI